MTRFARAKGSKASNERREEEPTPWHIMKQQLIDQQVVSKTESSSHTTNVLKTSLGLLKQQNDSQKEIWSDFGEKPKRRKTDDKDCENLISSVKDSNTNIDRSIKKKETKNNKKKEFKNKAQNLKIKETKAKINKKPYEISSIIESEMPIQALKVDDLSRQKLVSQDTKKKNKLKLNKVIMDKQINQNDIQSNSLKAKSDKVVQKTKNKKFKSLDNSQEINDITDSNKQTNSQPSNRSDKIIKEKNKVDISTKCDQMLNLPSSHSNKTEIKMNTPNINSYKHGKYQSNFHTIIANGREIKVVDFEGFLVKHDDAIEIKKLRKKLRAQQLPKETINNIIKLQRRKAEKSLAREKKSVCFHCRKFGHNFTDCPDIKNTDLSRSGVCFKCGSMEHSHYQCKVLQSQNFRYAVCFVCKEQGHIARQCKLNPLGQYPKGGSCHLCGENTHLRKDCPKIENETPTNVITVDKLSSYSQEDMIEADKSTPVKKKKTNLVKF